MTTLLFSTGSDITSGSLVVTGSLDQLDVTGVSGSFTGSVTGNVQGTADTASFVESASHAVQADNAANADTASTASIAQALNTPSTASFTTPIISSGSFETGSEEIAKGFIIYRLSTDVPARVRLYSTPADRDFDTTRSIITDPLGEHGVIADVLTINGNLSINFAPIVYGASLEVPQTASIAYTVNDNTGSDPSGSVTVTITKINTQI